MHAESPVALPGGSWVCLCAGSVYMSATRKQPLQSSVMMYDSVARWKRTQCVEATPSRGALVFDCCDPHPLPSVTAGGRVGMRRPGGFGALVTLPRNLCAVLLHRVTASHASRRAHDRSCNAASQSPKLSIEDYLAVLQQEQLASVLIV